VEIRTTYYCVCFNVLETNREKQHPFAYTSCYWVDVSQLIYMTADTPNSERLVTESDWLENTQVDITEWILTISCLTDQHSMKCLVLIFQFLFFLTHMNWLVGAETDVSELLKFPALCDTRKLITVFTRHLPLDPGISHVSPIHFYHPIS
jgi:hypothetical protein